MARARLDFKSIIARLGEVKENVANRFVCECGILRRHPAAFTPRPSPRAMVVDCDAVPRHYANWLDLQARSNEMRKCECRGGFVGCRG